MMVELRANNEAAAPAETADFDRFFMDQQQRVIKLCWFSTLDSEAAADVAQEAFARAYIHWEKISTGNPGAWIRTVALNLSRDRWRKDRRISWSEPPEVGSSDSYTDYDLVDALAELPGRQREVVVLRYWSDLKIKDCAAAMEISTGSAKQHLSRAHANLRRILGAEIAKELLP